MKKINRYKLLMTAKNQVGLFTPINCKYNSDKSDDYVLTRSFNHSAKNYNTLFDILFFMMKANKFSIKKNDVLYIKVNFKIKTYRCVDDRDNPDFVSNFVEIEDFFRKEKETFLKNLYREKRIYDYFEGHIFSIRELNDASVYTIKESVTQPGYYDLYRCSEFDCFKIEGPFKDSTTYQNVIYNYRKARENDSKAILIKEDELGVLNGA